MVPIRFHLPWHPCAHICFSTDVTKNYLTEISGFLGKKFGDAAKYCRFHNDSINVIKNTVEGNKFSVFLMMLQKRVHVDRNLQWRLKSSILFILTLFRMYLFGVFHGWGVKRPSLPKISHTYPTMTKFGRLIPYIKKIQTIYKSRNTPLGFCWHHHYFIGNQQIFLHQEIQI